MTRSLQHLTTADRRASGVENSEPMDKPAGKPCGGRFPTGVDHRTGVYAHHLRGLLTHPALSGSFPCARGTSCMTTACASDHRVSGKKCGAGTLGERGCLFGFRASSLRAAPVGGPVRLLRISPYFFSGFAAGTTTSSTSPQ